MITTVKPLDKRRVHDRCVSSWLKWDTLVITTVKSLDKRSFSDRGVKIWDILVITTVKPLD
jgi:hypothetical protein